MFFYLKWCKYIKVLRESTPFAAVFSLLTNLIYKFKHWYFINTVRTKQHVKLHYTSMFFIFLRKFGKI